MQELKVISDYYDFMLWMMRHTEKFPRHHRYSLGTRIETRMQTILGLLLKAKYRSDKAGYLNDANVELDILRFQIRLAMDLKALSVASQGHAAKLLLEIGAQIGGWVKGKGGGA